MNLDDNTVAERADFEVLDESGAPSFALVSSDVIDQLVSEYRGIRQRIEKVADFVVHPDFSSVLHYFVSGNATNDRHASPVNTATLFSAPGAIAQLNASYWAKALKLTDVYDLMPQKRRNEWNEQLRNPMGQRARYKSNPMDDAPAKEWDIEPLPDFTDEAVRTTLQSLIGMRAQFLSERVDGIFRGLSGEHVTNAPQAFGKRMIISHAITDYGTTDSTKFGLINDLRAVVAKFMGREEPSHNASNHLGDVLLRRSGEWVSVDGGAVRIRVYKKGTAHLEVHPDMAWRLNAILAQMHPFAIPASFRQQSKRQKEHELIGKPLPVAVIQALSLMTTASIPGDDSRGLSRQVISKSLMFCFSHKLSPDIQSQAEAVLQTMGGVRMPWGKGTLSFWQFDYEPRTMLDTIVVSGCIPEERSHQFYPTPQSVAEAAIEMADIGPSDRCLEPSAGMGNLAEFMPKANTFCVEIAPLHCRVLESKGYAVHEGDFLAWAEKTTPRPQFDRIVMNPPFSAGRAKAHTLCAYELLAPGGVLVAVLPGSLRNNDFLSGETTWSTLYTDEFAGTGVAVTIMKTVKP